METLIEHYEYLLRLLRSNEHDVWVGIALALVFAGLVGWILYLKSPRYWERAVARKAERSQIADLVSAALDRAYRNGDITAKVMQKYHRRLARALDIPDLDPKHGSWNGYGLPDLNKTKELTRQRLRAMGVDIAQGLKKIRRHRQKKSLNDLFPKKPI